MASRKELVRNNVRAGVFVSLSLLLAVAIIVILSDAVGAVLRSYEPYTALYPVADGVANMKGGAEVRVGGVPMGRVVDVAPRIADGRVLDSIEVRFELDSRVRLFADAQVIVRSPLLGSGAWLEIPFVGTEAEGPPPDGTLAGLSPPGMLASLLGPRNAGKAEAMVGQAAEFTEFLSRVPEEFDGRVVPILDDVKTVTGDLSETRWPAWAESVDEVMTWATAFTGELDGAVGEARGLMADGRGILAENREGVASIIENVERSAENVREVSDTLRTETIEKVHALLDSGHEALDDAAAAMQRLREDYERWAVDLGDTLAGAALASRQLKLATMEIRRSPWKVLYRPSATELEHEMLYEAARSFALAVADLNATSRSVDRILANHGEELREDRPALERIQRSLQESFQRYEHAQQQLFDVLVTDASGD